CAIAPRLERQGEGFADGLALRHCGDGVGPEVLRMGRCEADALDPGYGVDGAQEVGELRAGLTGTEGARGGGGVRTEQRDLAHAVSGELLDFTDDVAQTAADLATAHRRDDAERAGVVAPDLDRHPRRMFEIATGRQRRGEGVALLEDLELRTVDPRSLEQA